MKIRYGIGKDWIIGDMTYELFEYIDENTQGLMNINIVISLYDKVFSIIRTKKVNIEWLNSCNH